ncbi:hypothetical protein NDU88_001566 [Pleurodeles waltl]|uniref:Uncharacterized protein n=1 Tax=Pleurodeles waltl TaxID=8319 RepID=A0AAV7NB62_PLEWA|nr:hypothetical protein NDU88_001566 [Pleurodeles waltl]
MTTAGPSRARCAEVLRAHTTITPIQHRAGLGGMAAPAGSKTWGMQRGDAAAPGSLVLHRFRQQTPARGAHVEHGMSGAVRMPVPRNAAHGAGHVHANVHGGNDRNGTASPSAAGARGPRAASCMARSAVICCTQAVAVGAEGGWSVTKM